jgi:hypothetical protein
MAAERRRAFCGGCKVDGYLERVGTRPTKKAPGIWRCPDCGWTGDLRGGRRARPERRRHDRAELARRYRAGESVNQLASAFGTSTSVIREALVRAGVKMRPPSVRLRPPAPKAACAHGHPLTPENTYVYPSGRRSCRACRRAYLERHYQRRAQKAAA